MFELCVFTTAPVLLDDFGSKVSVDRCAARRGKYHGSAVAAAARLENAAWKPA